MTQEVNETEEDIILAELADDDFRLRARHW